MHAFPHFKIIKRSAKQLAAGIAGGAAIALLLSFAFPLHYRSDAQILIIPQTNQGVDPFTVARSAERIGQNLSEVLGTNDFYTKVKNGYPDAIDWEKYEQKNERTKRRLWNKNVAPSIIYGTGVMNISAYAGSKEEANALAGAVADTMIRRGWEYVGGNITIKLINDPVPTRFIARPNLFVAAVLGALLGLCAVMWWLFWRRGFVGSYEPQ